MDATALGRRLMPQHHGYQTSVVPTIQWLLDPRSSAIGSTESRDEMDEACHHDGVHDVAQMVLVKHSSTIVI